MKYNLYILLVDENVLRKNQTKFKIDHYYIGDKPGSSCDRRK